ncbi:MAG TPA: DUF1565 domain-containing protein [Acidimicrobiia bacterium]|nr:DUF1565 domain-containing protein [Acidimicrobiia bacterium]
MRPLPVASTRPAASGTVHYVDAKAGDDKANGNQQHPWKSVAHAIAAVKAGETIYLRAGTYCESATITASGTATAPITIRSAPGEVATIDAGLCEFETAPQSAWEPVTGGATGEYQSTATYSTGITNDVERGIWILGNFADSMVPLHGYRYVADLRSDNPYWTVKNSEAGAGVYLGPGLWFDWSSHRIHVRLAHTTLASQPNYTGETDPRKLPLVVGIDRSALVIDHAKHVRIQDIVFRGSATDTVQIAASDAIDLDGVTIYGGAPALRVKSTHGFRLVRSALRGVAAPWSSRASMKYRGGAQYLFVAGNKAPQSEDWEIAYDELTDSHDGIIVDSIKKLRLHHDRIDNFNDDGIYLALPPRDSVPEDVQIYENYISRVYTVIAHAQHKTTSNTVGPGVYVFRNVFDLREPTYNWIAKDADLDASGNKAGMLASRMCGDHGSPTWEPLFVYHNTIVTAENAFRNYYGAMLVMGTKGTKRRLFDNIFLQVSGKPGLSFANATDDLQVDGNLLWSLTANAGIDYFKQFRKSKVFEASKQVYAPGFGAHDVYGDPKLASVIAGVPLDARLGGGSPAIDAGQPVPKDWPDVLATSDTGAPDIGALPNGTAMFAVGPAAAPSASP